MKKVGDIVKIRSDLVEGKIYNMTDDPVICDEVTPSMMKYCGMNATITNIFFGEYEIDLDGGNWCWTDTMFEDAQ